MELSSILVVVRKWEQINKVTKQSEERRWDGMMRRKYPRTDMGAPQKHKILLGLVL